MTASSVRINRVGELYSLAPALGLSEGQAHWLAEALVRNPGAELQFDGAIVTVTRGGPPSIVIASATVPSRMPFEDAGAAYLVPE